MPTSADLRIAGVAAFQRLWNRHHPHHRLREDGEYDVLTNMAFDRAPAAGFHYATEQVAAQAARKRRLHGNSPAQAVTQARDSPFELARQRQLSQEQCSLGTAVEFACETSVANGLTQQIIAEMEVLVAESHPEAALVEVPDLATAGPSYPYISYGANVNPYLQKRARDALFAAIQAKVDATGDEANYKFSVNSMYRSSAQQYLLYRWHKSRKDWWPGVTECNQANVVSRPGTSKHEEGNAIDVAFWDFWKEELVGDLQFDEAYFIG